LSRDDTVLPAINTFIAIVIRGVNGRDEGDASPIFQQGRCFVPHPPVIDA